jgi:hypothetical protein
MDLTVANSVIGNELDGPAAEHDGGCNENFSRRVHVDKKNEEKDDVNSNNYNNSSSSNNNSSSSSIIVTTIAKYD